jgi:hypothetical protein
MASGLAVGDGEGLILRCYSLQVLIRGNFDTETQRRSIARDVIAWVVAKSVI